jgi:soluble lytic murein transglycosylase-like protein
LNVWIVVGVGLVLLAVGMGATAKGATLMPDSRYKPEWSAALPLADLELRIRNAARAAGIAAAQVAAIVYIESRGNPAAVNPSDPSYGLMALQIPTARAYADDSDVVNVQTLADPDLNLKCGSRFLADLSRKYSARLDFGEWAQAYNVGETKFNRGVRNPGYGAKILDSETGKRTFLGPGELAALFAGQF